MNIEPPPLVERENPLDLAARVVGGRIALAGVLNVTQAAVGNWKLRGSVPIEHCAAIERATAGAVTRQDLRPNDWESIWPELAHPGAARSCAAININTAGQGGANA